VKSKNVQVVTKVIAREAEQVAAATGCDAQCALRDLLTDVRHLANALQLDFDKAVVGSQTVYLEEQEDKEVPC